MRRWVVDASPLIFLAKIDRLNLLSQGAEEVLVPPAILQEVRSRPDEACRKVEDAHGEWLRLRAVDDEGIVSVLRADLDFGEAEVLALARQVRAERVILDDLDARRFARRLGMTPVGTVGLLLAARLRGEVPSLRNELDRLRQAGFRAGQALVEAVLREAGETE